MTKYTRAQVREARQKWIDFLKDPKRRKAKYHLARGSGARCCLGHACYVLDPKRETGWHPNQAVPPFEIVDMLGLLNQNGVTKLHTPFPGTHATTLTALNDETKTTPQQIGAMLEGMIEGGPNTPFKPLTSYSE